MMLFLLRQKPINIRTGIWRKNFLSIKTVDIDTIKRAETVILN